MCVRFWDLGEWIQSRLPNTHHHTQSPITPLRGERDGRAADPASQRLWFETATDLLLRRSDEVETPLGSLPESYDFDDYRRVDGVLVPFKIQWSRADYQVTFVFGEVKHNVAR